MMLIFARSWWSLALRGIAAMAFGVAALVWPDITLRVLVALFGAYALVDGVFTLFSAARAEEQRGSHWVAHLLEGVLGIAAGIATFVWPGITALILLLIIAAWAMTTGLLEIFVAFRLRNEIMDNWARASFGLSGLASLIFGLIVVVRPDAGILAVIWIIGVYAIAFGLLLLIVAYRLRGLAHEAERLGQGGLPHAV